jgi:sec-independent protein translocase protein TatC
MAVIFKRRKRRDRSGTMTVVEHLEELRKRLFISILAIAVGMAIAWPLYGPVFKFLTNAYCSFMKTHVALAVNPKDPCKLVFGSIVGPFLTKIKVVGGLGLLISLPVLLWEAWRFVTPGLTERERRFAIPFVAASVLLFALGAWFALVTLPKALQFLLGFAGQSRVAVFLLVDKYVGFVVLLTLAFGLSFEFPLVLISLTLVGVLSSSRLRAWRRWAVLFIAIFAAVITPSQDWFTMTAMMVPLLVFYELSILIARLLKR